ncbi:MAG: hypothetical protein FJX45_18095 [Alphaproteobacteria bacterium]|nr:hypothetical protein [Alphaproteobacteria bacterium]MBM3653815.1 hypothetical protein [Alphaproteobacteria bacterium]
MTEMTDKTSRADKPPYPDCHARFKARYLNALRGLLNDTRERAFVTPSAGLFIEPADPGCFLIASTGKAIGVIYDASGFANRPFRALLPRGFCFRARPPEPLHVFAEGPAEIELPEWAQPGDVHITPVCALLFPKMNHPIVEDEHNAPALANVMIETGNHWREGDFRLFENAYLPWRALFQRDAGPLERLHIDLGFLELFRTVEEITPDETYRFALDFAGDSKGVVIVRAESAPEFIGAINPQKPFDVPPLPSWLSSAPSF